MPTFNFTTTGGAHFTLHTSASAVTGEALTVRGSVVRGAVFKPSTAADRDALVNYLNGLDYEEHRFKVTFSFPATGTPVYRVEALQQDSGARLNLWVQHEAATLAQHIGVEVDAIKIEIEEVTP